MSDFYYSKEVPRKIIEGTPSFTTLPVRIHRDDARARKASQRFRAAWAAASTDSTQQLMPAIDTPFGHLVSLAMPECSPDLLELVAKLLDFGFLENDLMDTTEPQPEFSENNGETHQTPEQIVNEWFTSFKPKQKRIATELLVNLLATEYPNKSPGIDALQEYRSCRRQVIKPKSWEEFADFRFRHAGIRGCDWFLIALMGIDLDDETKDRVKHITDPLWESNIMANDYFSYAKEKNIPEENCTNGVKFLMQHEGMSEEVALNAIKVKAMELEQAHHVAYEKWLKEEQPSPELHRYIFNTRMAAAGAHFSQATSPRYGHYKPGLSHYYSQTWSFWLLALSVCVLLLALLMFYGADVEIGARLAQLSTVIDQESLLGNERSGGIL